MSHSTMDEPVQFLLTCIKFSNSGKVDFAKVAEECNIVTKAAAAKRYERLIKAYNASPPANKEESEASPKKTRSSAAKKAKAGEDIGPVKRKTVVGENKTRTKRGRVTRDSVLVCADTLVAKRLGSVKEEGSEIELNAHVTPSHEDAENDHWGEEFYGMENDRSC